MSSRALSSEPLLAVTLGDPNGIGPEVALRSWAALQEEAALVAVGSAAVLRTHAEALGMYVDIRAVEAVPEAVPPSGVTVLDGGEEPPAVRFGAITKDAGRLAMRAVEVATDLCRDGRADAMVTAPISKEAVNRAGYAIPGHTEFIAERTGASGYLMMMVAGNLRVALVTTHIAVRDVAAAVTTKAIADKLRVLHRSLVDDFGIAKPKIAVLGLNPHASDGGLMGDEEATVIQPALEQATREGIRTVGPVAADGFFGTGQHEQVDGVLAMYHDQGLVPFKALSFGRGVNCTAGLPIVRTSPDHGTAFDIAGQGVADPGSMIAALRLAAQIARRRGAG